MATKLFNEKIKEARLALGVTLQEIADESGLNISTVKNLERGAIGTTLQSKENVISICEVLGLNVEDVYIEDYRNTEVIAIACPKGGVAKTTTAIELCDNLNKKFGKKILVIDGDDQMSLSTQLRMTDNPSKSLCALLLKKATAFECIQKTRFENIDIIIGDPDLNGIDPMLYMMPLTELIFKTQIQPVIEKGIYDYIVMDLSNHYGIVNVNLLNACDKYYVPLALRAMAEGALRPLFNNLKYMRQHLNQDFKIDGILRTNVSRAVKNSANVDKRLEESCGDLVMDKFIRTDATIENAQERFMTISEYLEVYKEENKRSKKSKAATDYLAFTKEVISNGK